MLIDPTTDPPVGDFFAKLLSLGNAVLVMLTAGLSIAIKSAVDLRRGKVDTKSVETDTSVKVIGEWRALYEEQRDERIKLQQRVDEQQKRIEELEQKIHAEKLECMKSIEVLTSRLNSLTNEVRNNSGARAAGA